MSRNIARASLVAVLTLALGLAAVAPAGARESRQPATSLTTLLSASWLASAWDLVQGWLTGAPAGTLSIAAGADTTSSTADSGSGTVTPQTGTCIDPLGNWVPCSQI